MRKLPTAASTRRRIGQEPKIDQVGGGLGDAVFFFDVRLEFFEDFRMKSGERPAAGAHDVTLVGQAVEVTAQRDGRNLQPGADLGQGSILILSQNAEDFTFAR